MQSDDADQDDAQLLSGCIYGVGRLDICSSDAADVRYVVDMTTLAVDQKLYYCGTIPALLIGQGHIFYATATRSEVGSKSTTTSVAQTATTMLRHGAKWKRPKIVSGGCRDLSY